MFLIKEIDVHTSPHGTSPIRISNLLNGGSRKLHAKFRKICLKMSIRFAIKEEQIQYLNLFSQIKRKRWKYLQWVFNLMLLYTNMGFLLQLDDKINKYPRNVEYSRR